MFILIRQTLVPILTNLKSVFPGGDVHGADVSYIGELCVGVVFEEGENGDDAFWVDQNLQLCIQHHLGALNEPRKTLSDIASVVLKRLLCF